MVDEPVEVEVLVRGGHPDFLDLPWATPLALWDHERLVPMAHGVSRHVVRFVRYDNRVYALKETGAARGGSRAPHAAFSAGGGAARRSRPSASSGPGARKALPR